MQNKIKLGSVLILSIGLVFVSSLVSAEERVIEDTLVYNDPTVAKDEKVIYGGSLDYVSIADETAATGTRNGLSSKFAQTGLTAFAGKGNFTGSFIYRTSTNNYDATGVNNNVAYTGVGSQKRDDFEAHIRWLVRDFATGYMTPYVGIGAGQWNATGEDTSSITTGISRSTIKTSNMIIPTVGAIFPLNSSLGFRAEVKRYFYGMQSTFVSTTNVTTNSSTDNVASNKVILTMYYNLTKDINAQLGYQRHVNDWGVQTGYFMMLGYTVK